MESSKLESDLQEIIYKLRSTMQSVQLQYETLLHAVEICGNAETLSQSKTCIVAVETAHKEVLKFIKLNVEMALLTDELNMACIKQFGKI